VLAESALGKTDRCLERRKEFDIYTLAGVGVVLSVRSLINGDGSEKWEIPTVSSTYCLEDPLVRHYKRRVSPDYTRRVGCGEIFCYVLGVLYVLNHSTFIGKCDTREYLYIPSPNKIRL
jgi:hypothetical protein